MKHTQGKWEIEGPSQNIKKDKSGDYAIVTNGQIIAEAFNQTDVNIFQPALANAKLIAAAPELLEVCKQIQEWTEGETFQYSEELEQAIAKAEEE